LRTQGLAPPEDSRNPCAQYPRGPRSTTVAETTVVYVGGRPGSNTALKSLVESFGGEFLVHDGGIEDRKGLLAPTVAHADRVVSPVDCIDHDSMNMLKRVCERHGVPYHPVRTASVASFVELIARMGSEDAPQQNVAPPSRFCLRHG
jgi:hypothetical protein